MGQSLPRAQLRQAEWDPFVEFGNIVARQDADGTAWLASALGNVKEARAFNMLHFHHILFLPRATVLQALP